jgi:transposase
MSLGRKDKEKQDPIWIPYNQAPRSPGHPFYEKLNELLEKDGFDRWVEDLCARYFKEKGRRSIPPGVYFRMLMIGYFEGILSERAIAWRCADSMSLRSFLGYGIQEATPDHSSLTVWRQRLDMEIYQAVFERVLKLVDSEGLLDGSRLGVDATMMEANAAMRNIVRKDTKENYREYVDRLAEEAGEKTPLSASERVRFDRKRKGKKTSNKEWESPTDPDSRVGRMKDGRTRLSYKAENAVDLKTSIIVSARVEHGDRGDTATLLPTIETAEKNLRRVNRKRKILDVVADKGYHKAELIKELNWDRGITTYIPEKKAKGRRKWDGDVRARTEFHLNRQRCKREHGKALGRKRANLVERAFAHLCESGGMRRFTVRGLENCQKKYLIHALAYNLGVVMRAVHGIGTPRSPRERALLAYLALCWLLLHSILIRVVDSDDNV